MAASVRAGASSVLGRDGTRYGKCPATALPPRGIAHVCDDAIALLAADGRSLLVLPAPDADPVAVPLPDDLTGGAVVALATGRVAVACVAPAGATANGAPPVVTHVCLVDCVSPLVEAFAIPATPRPVVAIAPLATATLALVLDDGTAATWSPVHPTEVGRDSPLSTDVARIAVLWWDASVAATTAHPAALHAVGWVHPKGISDKHAAESTAVAFGVGVTGEIVSQDAKAVPAAVAAWLGEDSKLHAVPPAVGPLVSVSGIRAVAVQGANWSHPHPHTSYRSLSSDPAELTVDPDRACETTAAGVAPSWSITEPCPICFDDLAIGTGECVALDCGHVLHAECLEGCLARAEAYVPKGHRIVFNMSKCPQGCGRLVRHPVFPGSARVAARYRAVLSDVEVRAKRDYPGHAADEVMDGYLYYVCGTCGEPYWGGSKDCAAMMSGEVDVDPRLLQCHTCAYSGAGPAADPCPQHGDAFRFHKCSYCCNVASDFSLGRLWLCEACITEKRKEPVWGSEPDAVACVGTDKCPLGGHHRASNAAPVGCLVCFLADERLEQAKLRQPSAE